MLLVFVFAVIFWTLSFFSQCHLMVTIIECCILTWYAHRDVNFLRGTNFFNLGILQSLPVFIAVKKLAMTVLLMHISHVLKGEAEDYWSIRHMHF